MGNDKEKERSDIRQYIYVVRQLASKEIRRGNTSKTLGQLWNIINPIVYMMTLSLVFGFISHRDIKTMVPYVFTGIIVFNLYDGGMGGSLNALIGNKNLLIRTKIPKNILVIEKVYVALIRTGFSLIGYIAALIITQTRITPHIALLPIMLFLSLVIIIGMGKILAVINVYFADISYFYKILMRFVFFASAIFYDADRLSPAMQKVIMFNPVYLSTTFARACILYNGVPALGIWIRLAIYAAVIYIVGVIVFKKGSQDVVAKM